MQNESETAVVWGAGSKGVTFLNLMNATDVITHVVDINPRKQGMFVAGTGQPIIGPEQLTEVKPDLVLIMNPLYKDEIANQVRSLGLNPRFESL